MAVVSTACILVGYDAGEKPLLRYRIQFLAIPRNVWKCKHIACGNVVFIHG